MRSLFDIRRCCYRSPLVVISNMRCVDCREGDKTARAEVDCVETGSASLPVKLAQVVGNEGDSVLEEDPKVGSYHFVVR